MKVYETEAITDRLPSVLDFVNGCLEENGCSAVIQNQIDVAVEELFVNVALYAYRSSVAAPGKVVLELEIEDDPKTLILTIRDWGIPFNPLKRDDPDINLPAEQRDIGGLGIYIVKKTMDSIEYSRRDGQNVLTLKKYF